MSAPFITFKLFRFGARKQTNPFRTVQLPYIDEGRIPLKPLLKQLRLENAYLWDGNNVLLLVHDGEWSYHKFNSNGTYCLKVTETDSIDRSETFSSVSLETVVQDFGLEEEDGKWSFNYDKDVQFPQELQKTLEFMGRRHTLKAENSRRVLIELNILYAVEVVDPSANFLIMDGELGIEITREIQSGEDKPLQRIKYSGPLDFAVGHSQKGEQIPPDTALLITEGKNKTGFAKGFAQVLAQAASIVCIRRNSGRGHGECKSYFMYTDGERWIMGYVRPNPQKEQAMFFGRSRIFDAPVQAPYFDADQCHDLFKRIVGIMKLAYNSTPRNSFANLSPETDVDLFDQATISSELRSLAVDDL